MREMLVWMTFAWVVGFGFGLLIRSMWGWSCENAKDGRLCVPAKRVDEAEEIHERLSEAWWEERQLRIKAEKQNECRTKAH